MSEESKTPERSATDAVGSASLEALQARIMELEVVTVEQQTELMQRRAESVKANVLAGCEARLPTAYRALVVASENEEEVRSSLQAAVEQYRADFANVRPAGPAGPIGAPSAMAHSTPLPRWHGKRPSDISPQDWPAYRKEVLGIR